jgi:hypothetical protein
MSVFNMDRKAWEEVGSRFPLRDTGHMENDAFNDSSFLLAPIY